MYNNPAEEYERYAMCQICFNHPDACTCRECEVCGVVGDPNCYADGVTPNHGLTRTEEDLRNKVLYEQFLKQEAVADEAYSCWVRYEMLDLDDGARDWLDLYVRHLRHEFATELSDVLLRSTRGESGADLHVVVVLSHENRHKMRRADRLGHDLDMEGYYCAPMISVYSVAEWGRRLHLGEPIRESMETDGVRVLDVVGLVRNPEHTADAEDDQLANRHA